MKIKIISIGIICFISSVWSSLGFADVELQLSIYHNASKNLASALMGDANTNEKRVRLLFSEERIAVKSAKEDVLFDFREGKVVWRQYKDEKLASMDETTFTALKQRGVGHFSFVTPAEDLDRTAKVSSTAKGIKIDDIRVFNEWRWKTAQPQYKEKSLCRVWTESKEEQTRFILSCLEKLIDKCDALPKTEGIDRWCRALMETGELPVLIRGRVQRAMVFKFTSGLTVLVREIDNVPSVSNKDAKKLIANKTVGLRISELVYKLSWVKYFVFAILILAAFTLPFWGPRWFEAGFGRREAMHSKKMHVRDDIMKLYNFFYFLKEKQNISQGELKSRKDGLLAQVEDSIIWKKMIKKDDKERMMRVVDEFDIQKKESYLNDITYILAVCDELLNNQKM